MKGSVGEGGMGGAKRCRKKLPVINLLLSHLFNYPVILREISKASADHRDSYDDSVVRKSIVRN